MSIKAANSRFIVSPLQAAVYQHMAGSILSFHQLGNRLMRYAEEAKSYRRIDRVQEAGKILANIPLKEYQMAGQYYLGWCEYRKSSKKAKRILEEAAEKSPITKYRARAMLSLAAVEARGNDYVSELYYGLESMRVSSNLTIRLEALKGIAVIKAKEGHHQQALKDLESNLPLVRYAEPVVYYDYLNSLAVELGEVGRTNEARNISQVVINSPFAFAYPEWLETAQELRPASRSFAAIEPSKFRRAKLLQMPEIEHGESSQSYRPASVTNIQDWKADMGRKKKSDNDGRTYKDKSFEELDRRELLLMLVEIGTNKRMTDDKLYRVIVEMDKILNEPDQPKEPDDDPGA